MVEFEIKLKPIELKHFADEMNIISIRPQRLAAAYNL